MDFVTTQSLLCHLGRNMNKNTNVIIDLLLNRVLLFVLTLRTRIYQIVLAQGSETRHRATTCPVTSGPKRTSLGKLAPIRGICHREHRGNGGFEFRIRYNGHSQSCHSKCVLNCNCRNDITYHWIIVCLTTLIAETFKTL